VSAPELEILHARMSGFPWYRPAVLALTTLLAVAAVAQAQDTIDEILKKPGALSNQDRATLEAEIPIRVRRVFGGGSSAKPAEARDKLVKPVKAKGVNPVTRDVYAELIAASIESKLTEDDYDAALHTAIVFEELESVATFDGLLAGLRSKHIGVRYVCLRALTALRTKLKADPPAVAKLVSALGEMGQNETDTHVLRKLYICLNLPAVAPDLNLDDAVATALNRVLATRVRQIRSGQSDTQRDEEAVTTALACYKGAKLPQQAGLMHHLYVLLEVTTLRYVDPDTAPESLPAIGRLAQKMERVIHDCIKESKASPPSRLISDLLKPAAGDKQRLTQDARNALDELRKVLRGEPWKLP
jgi:hypothetical protein